jgi:trans-aconitate methyltransferase
MSLDDLAHRIGFTDKHTIHSYIPIYESIFATRPNIKSILEIGVLEGGSIKMWSERFPDASITGIDIDLSRVKIAEYAPNVNLIKANAYDAAVCQSLQKFDIIIDDGPHTLHSQKECVRQYLSKLNPNGVLIIEDVVEMSWIPSLQSMVPTHLHKHIKTHDLRKIKGRHDDIMFIVDLAA